MVKLLQHIPTNVITGFLGVGKTTAILHLLKHKPQDEQWAVLVNEFGKVGIDSTMLKQEGVAIREIPGGCMCCAAGVSVQVGLNALLASSQPDRLLIEPTGIGHPKQIIRQLSQPPFDKVLDMRACITLIDPRHLQDPRYYENEYYTEQLEIADALVANKTDLCDDQARTAFEQLVTSRQPAASGKVTRGQIDITWLDLPHAHSQPPSLLQAGIEAVTDEAVETITLNEDESFRRLENQAGEFASCGWLFSEQVVFDRDRLSALFDAIDAERIKASLHTDQGNMIFNADQGEMTRYASESVVQNRIEIIRREPQDWDKIEQALLSCIRPD